jgi:hypothetical protein
MRKELKMDRDNLINEVILYSSALSNLGVDTYQLLGEERVNRLEQMFEQLEEGKEEVEKMIKQFEEKLLRTVDELIKII